MDVVQQAVVHAAASTRTSYRCEISTRARCRWREAKQPTWASFSGPAFPSPTASA